MVVLTHREVADHPPIAYDLRGAALAVCVSERTLHYAIKGGHLKARKLGRKIVILREDLVDWLAGLPLDPASNGPEADMR